MATPGTAIPFRPETEGVTGQLVDVLLVLALLLSACLGAVWFAKKRGWLDKWIGAAATGRPSQASLRVEQVLRLSPRTTLYQVKDADRGYLIVESTATARIIPLDAVDDGDE
ncbi:hypothetical protein [Novilysobacter erysipheiresistens]|uniref:Flagellar biosynthetic protein FliO n=1 Tax=Novilysobacter erysipheiresistens TaxID=1749332 RepID=A0ABU7Z0B4_9GAMM